MGTTTAEPGVDLELDGGPASSASSGLRDRLELLDRVRRDLHALTDRLFVPLARHGKPGKDWPGIASIAELQRLTEQRHPQPAGAAKASCAGGLDDPVAVAVCLDHGH